MNRFLAAALMIALGILSGGCGKSATSPPTTGGGSSLKQAILGKWKGDLPGGGFVEFVFHSDGKFESYSSVTKERTLVPYTVIDEQTIETVETREKPQFPEIGKPPPKKETEEVRHRLRVKIDKDTLTLDEVGGGQLPVFKKVK